VRSVAVSADGEYVVAGSYDRIVYFFDGSGMLLWKYVMNDRVNAVAMSPDGLYCAACAGTKVVLFDRQGTVVWEYDSGNSGKYVGVSSSGTLLGPEVTAVALSASGFSLVFGTGGGDQSVYRFSFEEKVAVRPTTTPSFALPYLRPYLHTENDDELDLAPSVYLVSLIRENQGDEGTVTVRLAVPASWANSTGNSTVQILSWGEGPTPERLQTRLIGSDTQGNLVYEATARTENATFGAARVPSAAAPSGTEAPVISAALVIPVLAFIGIGALVCIGIVVWRKRKKPDAAPDQSDEEEVRSVQEALRTLQKK
jgi:hypothetical protein